MSRRALLAIVLGSAAMLPATASAEPLVATKSMPVTGRAPQVCSIQAPRVQSGALINFSGLDGDTLRVTEFANSKTLATQPASATVSFEAVCNMAHRVVIESENNGLWPVDGRIVTAPSGFTTAVPYLAQVKWNGASSVMATDAKSRRIVQQTVPVDAPAAGDIELTLSIAAGASNGQVNSPLIAGDYTDTVRITLEPQ